MFLLFLYIFLCFIFNEKICIFLQLSIEWHRISIQISHAVHKNSCYINTKCRLWLKALSETKIEYEANTFSLWKKKTRWLPFLYSVLPLSVKKNKIKNETLFTLFWSSSHGIWNLKMFSQFLHFFNRFFFLNFWKNR